MILNKSKLSFAKSKKEGHEGNIVVPYGGDSNWAYAQISQVVSTLNGAIVNEQKRSFLIRQEQSVLENLVKTLGNNIPGVLTIVECSENNIPANVSKIIGSDTDYHEQYIKRPMVDGVANTDECYYAPDGGRILRVTIWETDENAQDSIVADQERAADNGNQVNQETGEVVTETTDEDKF